MPDPHAALNFLFPRAFRALFGHNWVQVTREAAKDVANAFNSLVARGEYRVRARRFILQCVVAMFAEDIDLLAQDMFTRLLDECRRWASSNPSALARNADRSACGSYLLQSLGVTHISCRHY